MIVTVTLNPSLHVNYEAERIAWGAPNQVSRVRHRAGGRGLAVARVLHMFGHEVVAAGLAGGSAGEMIRTDLAASGVATQFTRIATESRRVLEVADASAGKLTTFAEPAPYITTEELGRLAADYRSLMNGATAVVLCGNLPEGLPPETYGTLATYAAEAGVPAILAAGGAPLRHAVPRRPALVIPDPGDDDGPAADPVALLAGGASAVAMLSHGEVRAVAKDGEWRASLDGEPRAGPDGEPRAGLDDGSGRAWTASGGRGHAGSRDAMIAGLVPGIALGWSWPDILTHAVALTAAALPSGEIDLGAYEALLPDVRVHPPG